jgi:predicted nucleotidyltransferase component of viral defense system
MITKQEILSVATISELLPTTIEKDYALSWTLYGISHHPLLSQWAFKGGTCLKKCYFETYRFSEDLDFTVPIDSIYNVEEILDALKEMAGIVYEESGLRLRIEDIQVAESINKRGRKTFLGKMTYDGPLGLPRKSLQRIKFDITNDEVISDTPVLRDVFNGYSDAPTPAIKVKCYSINEILAEKTRAMYERQGRVRDIYDVVNISRNFREEIDIQIARASLRKKFEFKSLPEPKVDGIFSMVDFDLMNANWENQLKHQLQILPPVKNFYDELKEALSWWIDEKIPTRILHEITANPREPVLPRVHFPEWQQQRRLGIGRGANNVRATGRPSVHLDHIRFAARNRLCINIVYHGFTRLVEPYSIRRPATGSLILYVYELWRGGVTGGGIKAYKISEISGTELTSEAFIPRYIVEL